MRRQEDEQALPDLDRAIALRPNYFNALMNRGDLYNCLLSEGTGGRDRVRHDRISANAE